MLDKSPKMKVSHKIGVKLMKSTALKPLHNSNVKVSMNKSSTKKDKKLKNSRSQDNMDTIKSYLFPKQPKQVNFKNQQTKI